MERYLREAEQLKFVREELMKMLTHELIVQIVIALELRLAVVMEYVIEMNHE